MQWRGLAFIIGVMAFAVGMEFGWYRIFLGGLFLIILAVVDAFIATIEDNDFYKDFKEEK